jgi:hypothetical protein
MNRDDIIRMAREAADATGTLIPTEWNDPFLERFANLIAAAEREACARVCEEVSRNIDGKEGWFAVDCADATRVRGNDADATDN